MKIGVKTFGDENLLNYFKDKSDFFEIMALQKNDYSFLKKFSLPIVIHAEHNNFGVNPADISKREFNVKSLNFARKIADMTNSKKIIVHPGLLEKGNNNCSLNNSINFFREIDDDRILIENLPKIYDGGLHFLCYSPEKSKEFIEATNKKFCFDVNHHLCNFNKSNYNYNFIKKYIKLNPLHYHIGGQRIEERKDHLCLADSMLNLRKILSYYPNNAEITLETEVDFEKIDNDLKIIRNVISELKSN